MEETVHRRKEKFCFVTTGATAPFKALIQAVASPSFIEALESCSYTHLTVQCGTAKNVFDGAFNSTADDQRLQVQALEFCQDGLVEHYRHVRETDGLVISHAGSGSILEALRFGIPLVVVPNRELLGNHQEELADAMQRSGYLIKGDVRDLAPAIKKAEEFRDRMAQFPPITGGKHRETKSFAAIMDETMGWE